MPALFIDVTHGLCNRLRAMASAAALAEATGRELVVIWNPDHHCECTLLDLINYDRPVLSGVKADMFRARSGRVYNYMEVEQGACFEEPILPDPAAYAGQDIYVRSAYSLVSPHLDFAVEQRFLRGLVVAESVCELVASVRHPNKVAAHIRMGSGAGYEHLSYEAPQNWPASRHQDLTEWRAKSHVRHFVKRLDQLIAEGRADTVFVAADQPETYQLLAKLYGDRVCFLQRSLYDRSARQLQYALADLLLLTAADLLLASTWSSFSDLAQRLAVFGRPFERSGIDF